ncbi:hypothetical protein AB0465_40650 [Streptomyces griseoviridis]
MTKPIPVRAIARRDGCVIAVNEGQDGEMHEFAWQYATITREDNR